MARRLVALLTLVPPVFVLVSWWAGFGLPYYKDSNESFLSHVQGLDLVRQRPWTFAFLTTDDQNIRGLPPERVYAHNPNFPRYAHALLLLLGVPSLPWTVLLLCVPVAGAGSALLVRLLRTALPGHDAIWIIVVLAFALDVVGHLMWTVNTYRVWTFPLTWGLLLAAARPPRGLWLIALAFVIFQYEYGYALWASAAFGALALLCHGRGAVRLVAAYGLGAMLSIAVFGVQVVSAVGVDGTLQDFANTAARRGGQSTVTLVTIADSLWTYLNYYWGPILRVVFFWGIASSIVVLVAQWRSRTWSSCETWAVRMVVAKLVVALAIGNLLLALTLRNYFESGMVRTLLPGLAFLMTLAVASLGLDLALLGLAVVRKVGSGRRGACLVRLVAFGLALAPLVSRAGPGLEAFPLLRAEFALLLPQQYRGITFMGSFNYHNLAHALTGGIAVPSSPIPTDQEIARAAPYRGPDGKLYYLCINRSWQGSDCGRIVQELTTRGHLVRSSGPDYAIVELVTA